MIRISADWNSKTAVIRRYRHLARLQEIWRNRRNREWDEERRRRTDVTR